MGDLSLGDKNFSDAGTDLFIDDALITQAICYGSTRCSCSIKTSSG
jgi:hypothetical protein